MAEMAGYEILAKSLQAQGVKDLFFIMGGPMRRDRLHQRPHSADRHAPRAGCCLYGAGLFAGDPGARMAASGPATLNFGTGLANALVDSFPVVAISGSTACTI